MIRDPIRNCSMVTFQMMVIAALAAPDHVHSCRVPVIVKDEDGLILFTRRVVEGDVSFYAKACIYLIFASSFAILSTISCGTWVG